MKVTITWGGGGGEVLAVLDSFHPTHSSFIFGFTCFDATVVFKAEFQFFQEPYLEELDFRVRVTDEKLPKNQK